MIPPLTLIKNAIEDKNILTFYYNGHAREVEPHHYGVLKGKMYLQAYQVAGSSVSGRLGWKNFEIDKIEKVVLVKRHFQIRADHHPEGSHYSDIMGSVS